MNLLSIIRLIIGVFIRDLPKTGLTEHVEDERDFSFGDAFLGAGEYTPKHRVQEIKTISIKNQQPFNTCCWASATVQKEVDEGVELSVKSLVAYGKALGRIQNDGFTTLRYAQQTIIDRGIAETSVIDDGRYDWASYSSFKNISVPVDESAKKHKSARYFSVNTRAEWFKALDDGKAIQTWMTWYTGYNMSGGLTAPFILTLFKGLNVGGHAFVCVGYDLDRGLLKFQNSFSKLYGDNGCFYIRISDWFDRVKSTGYVQIDVDNSTLFKMYEGKDVKSATDSKIYRIEGGKKRWFPDEFVFHSHGGRFGENKSFVLISDSLLKSIPTGPNMIFKV